MKEVEIILNPAESSGEMRNIFGMNNSPRIKGYGIDAGESRLFNELRPAYVRYHDAALENAGVALINVSQIFPLFHLDHSDPRNYIFKPTDEYLKIAARSGARIELRLGEDIEHSSVAQFRVIKPEDFEKWSEICLNILRHYIDGWADGLRLDFFAVTIWEEPNNHHLFGGTYEEYLDLFVTAYKKISAVYPKLSIGGPCVMGGFNEQTIDAYLARCRKAGIEPGFVSGTIYARDVESVIADAARAEGLLRKYGFSKTRISIPEMHLGPLSWKSVFAVAEESGFYGAMSAAFMSAVLISLTDRPLVESVYYYDWALGVWGLFSVDLKPYPIYYGLKFFSDVAHMPSRVECETAGDAGGVYVMAGIDDKRTVKLIVSRFDERAASFRCRLPGYTKCGVKTIADYCAEGGYADKMISPDADGCFSFETQADGCAVFLLEFTA